MYFRANLKANKIYIDLEFAPETLRNHFALLITNNSIQDLYFKISIDVPNWSVEEPTDGKLGVVPSGGVKQFTIVITRTNPNSEITETGNLILEAYSDSGYTNLVDSDTLPIEIHIVDIKSWDVQGWTFDDGTTQDWTTNGSVSSDRSVRAGGYSIKYVITTHDTEKKETFYIERSISIPSGYSKALFMFYFKWYGKTSPANAAYTELEYFCVKVNGNVVFEWGKYGNVFELHGDNLEEEKPWYKCVCDLSDYIGQTITLRIEFVMHTNGYNIAYLTYDVTWFDDPTLGYK